MAEPAPQQYDQAKGQRMLLVVGAGLLVAIVGVVVAANLRPPSEEERQGSAEDACKTGVEREISTFRAKRWGDITVTKSGDGYRVVGDYFAAGESADFVCTVDGDGNVTDVRLSNVHRRDDQSAAPGGPDGADWHEIYGTRSWAAHVRKVEMVAGTRLIVDTDLTKADLATALEICRAGKDYVDAYSREHYGVPSTSDDVWVRGIGIGRIAVSSSGRDCAQADS